MRKVLREIFSAEDGRLSSTRICMFIVTLVCSYVTIRVTGSICTVLEHWEQYNVKPDLSQLAVIVGQTAILIGALLTPVYGLKYFQSKEEMKVPSQTPLSSGKD